MYRIGHRLELKYFHLGQLLLQVRSLLHPLCCWLLILLLYSLSRRVWLQLMVVLLKLWLFLHQLSPQPRRAFAGGARVQCPVAMINEALALLSKNTWFVPRRALQSLNFQINRGRNKSEYVAKITGLINLFSERISCFVSKQVLYSVMS